MQKLNKIHEIGFLYGIFIESLSNAGLTLITYNNNQGYLFLIPVLILFVLYMRKYIKLNNQENEKQGQKEPT
jgi:hypothetical protein